MIQQTATPPRETVPSANSELDDVRPHLREALGLLLQAFEYAVELQQSPWDLAVELQALREARVTNSDLRWLSARGFIEHATETTGPNDRVRHFRRTALLSFTDATCIVLTASGVAMARRNSAVRVTVGTVRPTVLTPQLPTEEAPSRPKFDCQRRQLRLGHEIVKEFKLPSPNQETVLMALEEEGWPPRIDDPLPPVPEIDSRRRLHDTIKALNRKQKQPLLRFMGDGSGEGIRWELRQPIANVSRAVMALDGSV
jgi:hypothetical protein